MLRHRKVLPMLSSWRERCKKTIDTNGRLPIGNSGSSTSKCSLVPIHPSSCSDSMQCHPFSSFDPAPHSQIATGAAPQPDVSQAQPMDVSLDQKATPTATMQRAGTIATNNFGSGTDDLWSVAGHQGERADSMLPIANEAFCEHNC